LLKYHQIQTQEAIDDEDNFKEAQECHICNKKYNDEVKRARDHCHLTGKYRGSAHEACNLNFELTQYQSYFIIYEVTTALYYATVG